MTIPNTGWWMSDKCDISNIISSFYNIYLQHKHTAVYLFTIIIAYTSDVWWIMWFCKVYCSLQNALFHIFSLHFFLLFLVNDYLNNTKDLKTFLFKAKNKWGWLLLQGSVSKMMFSNVYFSLLVKTSYSFYWGKPYTHIYLWVCVMWTITIVTMSVYMSIYMHLI